MIDSIDRKLLDLLQGDARLSNAEMAKVVGLTISSVHERVKKLEKKGIIKGYVALVDPDKLGKPLLAFVRVSVSSTDAARPGMEKLCASEPDILECHTVAGEDCYFMKVRAESPKELEKIVSDIRNRGESGRTVTSLVLSTYKESSLVKPSDEEGDTL